MCIQRVNSLLYYLELFACLFSTLMFVIIHPRSGTLFEVTKP